MTAVLGDARTDVIILVTGSRVWLWEEPIELAFVEVEEKARATLPGPYRFGLVEGECPWHWHGIGPDKVLGSADLLAVRVAKRLQWHVFESRPGVQGFPADWDRYGSKAGPQRNNEMIRFTLALPGAHICIGFPTETSRGTWHCMREARRAGMLVWRVHEDGRIDQNPEVPQR